MKFNYLICETIRDQNAERVFENTQALIYPSLYFTMNVLYQAHSFHFWRRRCNKPNEGATSLSSFTASGLQRFTLQKFYYISFHFLVLFSWNRSFKVCCEVSAGRLLIFEFLLPPPPPPFLARACI